MVAAPRQAELQTERQRTQEARRNRALSGGELIVKIVDQLLWIYGKS